jgi:hypothetical protein
MQYDEKIVKAALSLILEVMAEDKQKIKDQTDVIEHLKTENKTLCEVANDYIRKCDELNAQVKMR